TECLQEAVRCDIGGLPQKSSTLNMLERAPRRFTPERVISFRRGGKGETLRGF
ncbi:hypothetical protein ALO_17051, partial [Acetonema longum DSM 6540]